MCPQFMIKSNGRRMGTNLKGEVIKLYSAGIIAHGLNPHTVGVKNKQGHIFHYSFNDV